MRSIRFVFYTAPQTEVIDAWYKRLRRQDFAKWDIPPLVLPLKACVGCVSAFIGRLARLKRRKCGGPSARSSNPAARYYFGPLKAGVSDVRT
jgi:hypothetical protein